MKLKLSHSLSEMESRANHLREERDMLAKDKENLEDLIKQTQHNSKQMRDDKERLSGQIS